MKSLAKTLLALALATSFAGCTKSKPKLWIYTSVYKEVVEELKPLVAAAVPEAEVEWYQGGSEDVAAKVTTELAAGKAKADLLVTSDPFWYHELKLAGKLLPYQSAGLKSAIEGYSDPDGAFIAIRLPVMVGVYNSDVIKPEALPKTWKDLTAPEFKGKLAMPSPLESGTTFTTVALLSKKYGWEYFQGLRQNEILSAGGNSSVITRVETKEKPLGIVLLENVLKAQSKGSPVRPIYFEDGIVPIPSPMAILKDSDHPELAKKIFDYLATPAAQAPLIKSGMYSLIPDQPNPPGARPLAEVLPKMMTWNAQVLDELYAHRDEIKQRSAIPS